MQITAEKLEMEQLETIAENDGRPMWVYPFGSTQSDGRPMSLFFHQNKLEMHSES